MAGFEGVRWAPGQYRWSLRERAGEMLEAHAATPAVSRSLHYGLFLAFEGIRFFVQERDGLLEAVFVNLRHNARRFREGIAFNLDDPQQELVPSEDELERVFIDYLAHPALRPFVTEMARSRAQGYLRPFTVDDTRSIGVTFPTEPVVRIVAARYDSYLGEPFVGVSVPWLVRAVGANGTGRLKLGVNYLMSVKAVQAARRVDPRAAAALFLDDRPDAPLAGRRLTEWDTSCALLALADGTVVRIPDNPLILPSVTVRGIAALLRARGVRVEERDVTYGELVERARAGEIVAVCSVGTAGILNRCAELVLLDDDGRRLATAEWRREHDLSHELDEARRLYWAVYRGDADPVPGLDRTVHPLGPPAEG